MSCQVSSPQPRTHCLCHSVGEGVLCLVHSNVHTCPAPVSACEVYLAVIRGTRYPVLARYHDTDEPGLLLYCLGIDIDPSIHCLCGWIGGGRCPKGL